MTVGGVASGALLAVLGWALAASSPAPIPLRVDWRAPAGCSSAEVFFEGVRTRTDRVRAAREGEEGLRLQVRLSRAGSMVHGELRVIDDRGETDTRGVDGASCDEVVEALSLTAALAIDPNARPSPASAPVPSGSAATAPAPTSSASTSTLGAPGAHAAAPSSSAAATPSGPSTAPPKPPSPPAAAAPAVAPSSAGTPGSPSGGLAASHRSRAGHIAVGAEAFVTEMVSPLMSIGGAVAARWTERSGGPLGRSVGIAVMYVPEDFAQPSNEIAIRFTGLSLRACPFRLGISSIFDIQPCAFGVGGWLTATDRKVSHPTPVVRSFVSAGALARAGLSMGSRVIVELQAGISTPLFSRRFVTTVPDKVVGETPTLSPILGLGFAYALF